MLLDDPLSAVDSHTARYLYDKLFLGPLIKNRTVILVTRHVELVLTSAYYLVRMLEIDIQGTAKELRERGALAAITLENAIEGSRRLRRLKSRKKRLSQRAAKLQLPLPVRERTVKYQRRQRNPGSLSRTKKGRKVLRSG